MKYYVYISQSKIDLLYDQITSQKKDTIVKGGINIGILSVETEFNSNPSLYDKLDIVVKAIPDISDMYSDADYIQGTLAMGWNARNRLNQRSNATYWIGESLDTDGILNKILLIGSQHHIIGNEKSDDYCYSTSYIDAFFNDIENRINFNTLEYTPKFGESEIESENDKDIVKMIKSRNFSISDMKWTINHPYLADFIDEFSEWHSGIFQEYEFLAKLFHSEIKIDDSGHMIRYAIASPIYVAISTQINKRVILDGKNKKYIISQEEYEQYKIHDFSTIHLLLKRSGLDEENFTKEMKDEYKKCNGRTESFDRDKFIANADKIVKKYFYLLER